MSTLLPVMILLPLATAVVVLLVRSAGAARWISLLGTLATLVCRWCWRPSSRSCARSTASAAGPVQPRLEFRHTWMTFSWTDSPAAVAAVRPQAAEPDVGRQVRLEFYFGLDGISLLLVVLTALLMVVSVLVSWESIRNQAAGFYACLLLLETGLLGAFCAFDLLLFYVFFEITLIPLFFLIGIWGGPQRQYAAYKFFLYTLAGSVLTLVGLIALVLGVLSRGDGSGHAVCHSRTGAAAERRRGAAVSPPVLDLPGLVGRLRDQGAAVPVPHLVAAGAHRSADGRLRDPGRRAAEAGHVRLPAAVPAAVAGRHLACWACRWSARWR